MSRVTDARRRALVDAAARAAQLQFTYADIAKAGGIAVRGVGSYMRAQRWPNGQNQMRLEHALGWPAGELRRREMRYAQAPERGMRWVVDTVYRLRIANRILRDGVKPEDRPGGVAEMYVEATLEADPAVPFDLVEAILDGIGVDVSEFDHDGSVNRQS